MPTVPTYDSPKVREAGLPSVYRQSTPDTSGAIQQGLQQFGAGVGQFSHGMDLHQQMLDEASVKQLDVEYGELERQVLFDPTTGYMAQKGINALNMRPDVERQLQDKRQELESKLTNTRQQTMFTSVMGARMEQSFRTIDAKAQGETQTYLADSTAASKAMHLNAALSAFPTDPGQALVRLQAARHAQEQLDHMNGVSGTTAALNDLSITSQFGAGVVEGDLARNDAYSAQSHLQQFRPMMAQDAADKLLEKVNGAVRQRKALDFMEGAITSGGMATPGPEGGVPAATGPIPAKIVAAAQSAGLSNQDAANMVTMAAIESSFRPDATNGSSTGVFQFKPDTFKQYGGDPAKLKDPDENIRIAAIAYKDERNRAQKALNREPSAWEIYLVHQQGSGGGPALLRAGPHEDAIFTLEAAGVSPARAKASILKNIPQEARKALGDNPTVGQFLQAWKDTYSRKAANGAKIAAASPSAQLVDPSIPSHEQVVAFARAAAGGDPELEASLISAGQSRISMMQADKTRREQDAIDTVQPYLRNPNITSPGQIPAEVWSALPQTTQTQIQKAYASADTSGPYAKHPDPQVEAGLHWLMNNKPDEFMKLDPTKYVAKLDQGTYGWLLKAQDDARQNRGVFKDQQMASSRLMSVSANLLKAAGIDEKTPLGAKRTAQFQQNMLRWAENYDRVNPNKPPSDKDVQEAADRMLLRTEWRGPEGTDTKGSRFAFEVPAGTRFYLHLPQDTLDALAKQYAAAYPHTPKPSRGQLENFYRQFRAAGIIGGYPPK